MVCRNGHDIEQRVFTNGHMRCPVCARESNSRRTRRYYERNKDVLNARPRGPRNIGW